LSELVGPGLLGFGKHVVGGLLKLFLLVGEDGDFVEGATGVGLFTCSLVEGIGEAMVRGIHSFRCVGSGLGVSSSFGR